MRVILIENEDGRLSADFVCGIVLLHVKFWRWSARKLREYRRTFTGVLEALRQQGYPVVYATPYEADKRAQKLISMFGFKRVFSRGRFVLMRRGTGDGGA